MKKISFFGLCLLTAVGVSAQTDLVKQVERTMKSSPDKYPANLQTLKPAFTNPETAEDAYVWYVAGKGGMDFYDNQQKLLVIGNPVDKSAMGHALVDGYGFLMTALEKDPVTDAKGKVKTKYTKDATKLLVNHYNDFNNAAVYMWEAQDYDGAYDSWTLFATMPDNPVLKAAGLKQLADSTLSDIYYNRALAAWQANKLENALESFDKAISLGYDKQQVYDYAIGVSSQMGNSEKVADYAAKAYQLFGNEGGKNYIGYMINDKLKKEQFDDAEKLLNEYIQQSPNDPQLYFVLGYVYDFENKADDAKAQYKKALDLNPDHAQANLNYGRQLYNQGIILGDDASTKSAKVYNEVIETQVNPLFREAAQYLEKAYKLDPDNCHSALPLLRTIYYNLNDSANLQRIEAEM